MNDIQKLKAEIRFLTHAVVHQGKKVRVHYSKGGYTKESGLSDDVITIYSKDYGWEKGGLPAELNPKNDSDMMTDYFETDRARVTPESKYYKDALKAYLKAKAKDEKMAERRRKRWGWA